jgi:NAD(P)-dependent dehydrogenase (short-subunit alcohol dehydrogenase family)
MGAFDGEVVFVTGALSKIRRATSVAFGRAGASVGVGGQRALQIDETCHAVAAAGRHALPLPAAAVPLRHVSSPADIADVALCLCSPQAVGLTGAVLAADGGFVLG